MIYDYDACFDAEVPVRLVRNQENSLHGMGKRGVAVQLDDDDGMARGQ